MKKSSTDLSTTSRFLLCTLLSTLVLITGFAVTAQADALGAAANAPAEHQGSPDTATHAAHEATPDDATPASEAADSTFPAETALEFEEKLDGRCYILSEGGKLVVMHNRSPSASVRYRLVRLFADRPQMGRTTGIIGPGEQVKLGCSEVDGRRQHWRVERAAFVQ